MKTAFYVLLLLPLNTPANAQTLRLQPHPITLQKGNRFNLFLPEGYQISVAYEGLQRPRFMAKSPDGRLFVTDMLNRSDNKKGKLLIFDGWDSIAHRYSRRITYLADLHNPNQCAFYNDKGQQYLYVAETGVLKRYPYRAGDTLPSGKAEIIARFPDYGLSYKYGGWHLTRSLTFNNSKLYVSVGSSCNACIEQEEVRATIIEMNPDGSNPRFFARGLRNSVAIKWVDGKLWATSMGRDLIGPDKPEDLFHTVERDQYYGWPFYIQYRNKIYPDPQFKDSVRAAWVKLPPVAYCGFKAHSAPLGFDYFRGFGDPLLRNHFLVALHGSTSVWRQRGNSIVMITGRNRYTEVVSGFLSGKTEKDRHGRPCDVLMQDANSFFITDDHNGVLYYVWR
jgi:glucose/arabinose dehydrogenase